MNSIKLLFKSLRFYRKQHLSILLGTIISTAVLTGAFITGDSIKFSLNQLVESRLGNTEYILQTGDRFVSTELAKDLARDLKTDVAALTLVNGITSNPENQKRINRTQVIAVNDDFWSFSNYKYNSIKDEFAIVSENTAEKLGLNIGDEIVLRVENLNVIPINSPFSQEENPSVAFRLKIQSIASENELGLFNLKSNQVSPYNVFVAQSFFNQKLDIAGLSNVILVAPEDHINPEILNRKLGELWQLEDAGLELKSNNNSNEYELTSNRIFIDKQISKSFLSENKDAKRIITYLVNTISYKDRSTPYSFVTAVNSSKENTLKENEILINEWLAEDIEAGIGDTINLDYFIINQLHNLSNVSQEFIVKGIIENNNEIADESFMPKFPGFEKAMSCSDWNTNIPIDLKSIRDKDENYWNILKGTPKAIISIEKGLELWENQFGNYTAIRLNSDKNINALEQDILSSFSPEDLNLIFLPAKQEGVRAANSGVDFGQLFLSLSFFVIAAALLLIILLYSIQFEARNQELGVLLSLGFSRTKILNNRVYESTVAILVGGIIGVFVGILYNMILIEAINSVWIDIVRTNTISININMSSLAKGALAGIETSAITIYFLTIIKLRKTPVGIINNRTSNNSGIIGPKNGISLFVFIFFMTASLLILSYSIFTSVVNNSSLFLMAGALFMIGCYALFNFYIKRKVDKNQALTLNAMAFKNIGRNLNRSMTIVVLLSLGTFTVLITGANRKTFSKYEDKQQSGTGGYAYWAETSLPISDDLNREYGREEIGLDNAVLGETSFLQMYSLDGDDASCLNLNQVQQPTILSVNPQILNDRQSFSFATLQKSIKKKEAWLELNKTYDNNVIPAFADQTVIQWGIMKKLGDTIVYANERGEELFLVLVGGLNASVFQGNILISDANFIKHFPSSGASSVMLIDTPKDKQNQIAESLESDLRDYGIVLSNTSDRLAQFYSVTNTYLTVFMILGGLGVLIATLGLGIIIYRNLIDRKQELALLMATGFHKDLITKLIFRENLALIVIGMLIGIVSAIIGILPSLLSTSFHIPGTFVFALILIIFINSILWAYFPIHKALKKNITSSLRNE